MRKLGSIGLGAIVVFAAAVAVGQSAERVEVSERARQLHARAIVVDTHSDTPQRMIYDGFDMGHRDADGHVDIPRMREGGLDAPFFSIWVSSTVTGPEAVKIALRTHVSIYEKSRTDDR